MSKEIALLDLNLKKKSPRTRQVYGYLVKMFLGFAGSDLSRAKCLQFMEKMENEGYGNNSRRLAHYALAKLYKSIEVKFPLDGDDLTPLPSNPNTPYLSPEQIGKLIAFWSGEVGSYETSLLYLATIYGLRSLEMTDADIGERLVVYMAKKRGGLRPPREHLLPGNAAGFISGYEHMSERTVLDKFHRICDLAGVNEPGYGAWHTIRRTLSTQLQLALTTKMLQLDDKARIPQSDVVTDIVTRYLRWEKRRGAMPSVYFHLPPEEIDQMCFSIHPFLRLWI